MQNKYDTIIIGSGIAGLSAGIYAARGNNNPIIIRGDEPGGQLTLTTDVANYPGFPDGISGPELINKMEEQATQFGAEITHGIVTDIDDKSNPFNITLADGTTYLAQSLIIASGAAARTLDIPGENELMGHGVSTCATCDGAFFKGSDMAVVGGGDAAAEEASFLTKFADTVYLIHRRDTLRAEAHWTQKIQEHQKNNNIEVLWNTEVTRINGTPETGVENITTVTHPNGHPTTKSEPEQTQETLSVNALFVAIGHTPNTDFLESTDVQLAENGYIKIQNGTGPNATATSVDGIYAAGDVADQYYQQAVTAAGTGVQAALDVDHYLSEK